MKKSIVIIMLCAAALVVASCGPAENPADTFAGTWTANLGTVNFVLKGDEITGVIEGYGGNWNESFSGTVNGNEAAFTTDLLGGFTLILDGDTFKTKSPELSFCGIRNSKELPAGCGFSGKWIVPSKYVFLEGSYMILTQTGSTVTGDLFSENDTPYDSFTGEMEWGKGWRANGESTQRGELSLWLNASETGFEFFYGSAPNSQQLCAVREGVENAYLGSYYCQP